MKRVRLLIALFALSAIGLIIYLGSPGAAGEKAPPGQSPEPQRVISMAPSITEVLYELGLQGKLVGATRFCNYPPEAKKIPRVGGYMDPNYEAIVMLRPDLVITIINQKEVVERLHSLGIETLLVDHDSVDGIINSITAIGHKLGAKEMANKVAGDILHRLEVVKRKTKGEPRPKVLVAVGRYLGSGMIQSVHVAGKGSYLDDIITLSGGVNAYDGPALLAYPRVSGEGLIRLDSDYIIDMAPTLESMGMTQADALKEWRGIAPKKTLDEGRLRIFWQDYTVIPGPRFILMVERIARLVHPEIKWN